MGLKEVVAHREGGGIPCFHGSHPIHESKWWRWQVAPRPHPSLQSTGFMWELLEMQQGCTLEPMFGLLGLSLAIWRALKTMLRPRQRLAGSWSHDKWRLRKQNKLLCSLYILKLISKIISMCAVVFDSPDAHDSAPVYHFPNQCKMAQRGDTSAFQNKTAGSAEVRVKGRVARRPNQVPFTSSWEVFWACVQIAADTVVILSNSNTGIGLLKSHNTLRERLLCLVTCCTGGQRQMKQQYAALFCLFVCFNSKVFS